MYFYINLLILIVAIRADFNANNDTRQTYRYNIKEGKKILLIMEVGPSKNCLDTQICFVNHLYMLNLVSTLSSATPIKSALDRMYEQIKVQARSHLSNNRMYPAIRWKYMKFDLTIKLLKSYGYNDLHILDQNNIKYMIKTYLGLYQNDTVSDGFKVHFEGETFQIESGPLYRMLKMNKETAQKYTETYSSSVYIRPYDGILTQHYMLPEENQLLKNSREMTKELHMKETLPASLVEKEKVS
ncbi:hypothetical protein A3Q56_03939 [Intoshia linei]|uniref:Uncharacterized protein n=1 Tax=Intoshia linei TaxID=1819745 RepID=A0A177B3Y8_9BILA|nr:hypothetical protein A3Q56_03939 [Intoshia linei]